MASPECRGDTLRLRRASRLLGERGREKTFGNLRTYIETAKILSAIGGRVAESRVEAVPPPTGLSGADYLIPGNERLERASERALGYLSPDAAVNVFSE